VTPASWPIGMGRDFLGAYDLFADALLLFERGVHDRVTEPFIPDYGRGKP
jgi:peptide chain release factor 3